MEQSKNGFYKDMALVALIGYMIVLIINQSIEISRLKQDIENIRYEVSKLKDSK